MTLYSSELLFLPQSRKANNIDISGSVVIFDEAHNLVSHCCFTYCTA